MANINTLPPRNAEVESAKTSTRRDPNVKERAYYVDWIRSMAIVLVILVHALCNSFDASGLDPDDVPALQQKKDGIIKCLVQIGIPMFFYISGIGATFFNTEEKNFGIFVGEKSLRLLLPFIVGIFAFLIPRLYFGQTYEDFTRPNDEIENNYWDFTKKTLPGIHLKLSWLWYLPALFIDFMICYPLLRWSVRRSQGIKYDPLVDTGIIAHQMVTLAIWGSICYFIVTKDDYGSIYLVPAVATLGCVMAAIYSVQLALGGKQGYKGALLIKLIGPCGSIAMNYWKVQTKNQNLYHIFLMINFDAIFFSQGVIDMCYWRKMIKLRRELGDTVMAPAMVGIGLLLYALCSPMNYGGLGQLFFYPLYDDYWLQCLYTTGTWLFVFTIVWITAHIANDKFNETFFKYFTGAALYSYLSHYFFIILLSVMIVRPYKLTFP
jgi:peptidoglycan/LPS O-acetylase OafA/YrhL